MTIQHIADRLHTLCQQADYETVKNELYAHDATSTESNRHGERETARGKEALAAKSQQFQSMVEEMFSSYVQEPKVFGPYIFMEMGMDVKMKGMERMTMTEMCRYEVKDGKIISEEFYY